MKIQTLILFVVLLVLAVGCGNNAATPTATAVPATSGAAAAPSAVTETIPATQTPVAIQTPAATETTATQSTVETVVDETAGTANADVVAVRAVETAAGVWTFHVTVAHPDTGWEDYADGWDVVLPDGAVIRPDPGDPFTRLLLHPHVEEQPFTRSQSGIEIPVEVTAVTVRAHDLVDGWGGQEVAVDLTANAGENFTVERLEE